MTFKTSLVTAVVAASIVLAVPAAWGQTQPARLSSDAVERAVLAREQAQRQSSTPTPDAFERAVAAKQDELAFAIDSHDAHQRTDAGRGIESTATYRDAFERAALGAPSGVDAVVPSDSHDRVVNPSTPASLPTITSGRAIEWPQIGVGFVLGILLVAVLWLPLRTTRSRPLAQ